MRVLGLPIQKKEWLRKVGRRNGVPFLPENDAAEKAVKDAGPWEPVVQKIAEFHYLVDGWDGFGAKAPSPELVESAIALAWVFFENGVSPPHCVTTGVDGAVILEWQDPDGTVTEGEIVRPLYAEVMVIEPGKPAKQWTLPTE
jgi:hypothetical protein